MNQGEMEDGTLKNVGVGQGDMEYGVLIFAEAEAAGAGIWAKISGIWTAIVSVWTKVSGAWVEVDVSAKAGGTWRLIHEK